MPLIEITSNMKNLAYDFSERIINGNNQYNRMLPEYVADNNAANIVRINRTFVGKLAELCFLEYLRLQDITIDVSDMFEIFEGQENVDDFDFKLQSGETIEIKAAIFNNHSNLVVPIDQFENIPKDYYVGIKFVCNIEGNNYRLINRDTFEAADIRGYCTYDELRNRRTTNLGEFPCKTYPLRNLRNINDLIRMF